METVRNSYRKKIEIKKCPECGQAHMFDITTVIDELVGGMFLMTMHTENVTCSLICPTKNSPFAADIPITLSSGQSLVRVK
jgi:hypothetical protein